MFISQDRGSGNHSSFPFRTKIHIILASQAISWLFLTNSAFLSNLSSRLTSSNDVRQPTSVTSSKVRSILPEVFRNKLMRAQTCHALLLLVLISLNYLHPATQLKLCGTIKREIERGENTTLSFFLEMNKTTYLGMIHHNLMSPSWCSSLMDDGP